VVTGTKWVADFTFQSRWRVQYSLSIHITWSTGTRRTEALSSRRSTSPPLSNDLKPMWLKCLCRDQLPIHSGPAVRTTTQVSEPSGSEQPSGIIGLGLDFSDAISRRVLLDTASLVEGNNVVLLPRVARE
jgi:hypothetical protein